MLLTAPAHGQTWTEVALTLDGKGVDNDKRDDCVSEANKARIKLVASAPISGTLYFLDSDDYLESASVHGGRYMFAMMGASAECRLALAKMVDLESYVETAPADPKGCKSLGTVEGSDAGWMLPGNYDAAVAEAQFNVLSQGGNYFSMDVVRQLGNRVIINGRAFACSANSHAKPLSHTLSQATMPAAPRVASAAAIR